MNNPEEFNVFIRQNNKHVKSLNPIIMKYYFKVILATITASTQPHIISLKNASANSLRIFSNPAAGKLNIELSKN
jgi:hypothetical protein